MECFCDLGDPPYFYVRTVRTARKVHRCYECRCEIQPGERYEELRAMWERNRPELIRTCPDCVSLREAMSTMDCFCWMHGSLLDDVHLQFEEAHFPPALRFNLLREVAAHRRRRRAPRKGSLRVEVHHG